MIRLDLLLKSKKEMHSMNRCFVIQPFDNGKYDKRYDDVLSPAIKAAGLDPYRVDRDPHVSIPIDDIQSGIESSRICLADITTDNPNVWFELGYAIASKREVVMICSSERESKFPFDVQHYSIINYTTESSRDFEQLGNSITERLKARLQKERNMHAVGSISPLAAVEGLEHYEIAALVAAAQELPDPTGGTPTYALQNNMENAGFAPIATTLGVRRLIAKGMLEAFEDENHNGDIFTAYRVTDAGMAWLFENTEKLKLKSDPPERLEDEDIPF
jgi:hypothetical protein